MTQEQRINSEIEAMSKRIETAYANDPRGRIDAYMRIAWIVGHCPTDSLIELLVTCFPFIQT